MTASIAPNGDLMISCTAVEQTELQRAWADDPAEFLTDRTMRAALEFLVTDHEYEWTEPAYCAALTDAPMFAVYGDERPLTDGEDAYYLNVVGRWHDKDGVLTTWVEEVEACWAYMDYQLRSPLEDLAERGLCVFQHG